MNNRKKIIFIADFFSDQILGGGELNNEELFKMFNDSGYNVEKKRSHEVEVDFLLKNKINFFIVFNFVNLSHECRDFMRENNKYIIYEHDHKYLKTRNPADYKNFKAPIRDIINYHFYKNAKKIFSQSKFHENIINSNLMLDNVDNLGGNLWSLESMSLMREISKKEKHNFCSIMSSTISHKNTFGAIEYCKKQGIEHELVSSDNYLSFLKKLGKNKRFIFLPQTPETLSRVVVEARMMGVSVIANSLVGASSESWFSLKGEELIDFMLNKRKEIFEKVENELEFGTVRKEPEYLISILTTFCDGERFIKGFLDNITKQTIFDRCELIVLDANSQGNERKTIEEYLKRYDNIKYIRHPEKIKPGPSLNSAMKESTGTYITWAMIDDRKVHDCLQNLLGELSANRDIDLCYGDCMQTDTENHDIKNIAGLPLSQHSKNSYSRENMIKCLPGPMPMWRKQMVEKNGFFDEDGHDYADDWEMWLRCIESGSRFKKIDKVVGLYYTGGRTQQSLNTEQRKEEAKIFFRYSEIFGKQNFLKYKDYFMQFLET